MAITHPTNIRNVIADAVVDAIDSGTTATEGKLRIYDSGKVTLLAELDCSNPAFGAAASGTSTAAAITDATAGASGTAAEFEFVDRDGNEVFSGSVTATGGGGDLELNSVSIANGATVSITSFTYSAPN